jgi:hypothetical protein
MRYNLIWFIALFLALGAGFLWGLYVGLGFHL